MLFDIHNIILDELHSDMLEQKKIKLCVARLDKIHPVISGNKLFKLYYFLEEYKTGLYESIQTFGGAHSNHLVATAYSCSQLLIPCKGFIRGEKPAIFSHTLQQCAAYGMQLEFLSRSEYAAIANRQITSKKILIIPEGGYHPLGARGASLILDNIKEKQATHVCLAAGTATTLAGILQKADHRQTVIAVPILKGLTDIKERLDLLNGESNYGNLKIWDHYHFGGYAKKTMELIAFMNEIYLKHAIPTDVVYTAKMMYGVFDSIHKDEFLPGSRIICLHTGGLQGNNSLPPGSLIF
ncbi:MAG: pyridoxal-phosphate dependent enzyme [Rhizobacter sp.]|nr:pyridoxal-phosphate dependent enzyme [Ferruginibacter sp.]